MIKDTLTKNLQYACSVGVAKNKLLAKVGDASKSTRSSADTGRKLQIASQRAKPAGICIIAESDVQETLASTEVYKLPGCGEYSRIGEALTQRGCKFVADRKSTRLNSSH